MASRQETAPPEFTVDCGFVSTYGTQGSVNFTFAGPGFSIWTTAPGDPGNIGPTGCKPCKPGGAVTVDSTLAGDSSLGTSVARADGHEYKKVYCTGTLTITGHPIKIKKNLKQVRLRLDGRCKLRGELTGYLKRPVADPGPPIFHATIKLRGVVRVTLNGYDSGELGWLYTFDHAAFVFGG